MAFEYRHRRRVEFAETDMAGIVHFTNYFRYMEMAEHEFLRSLGHSVHGTVDGRTVSWPRVRVRCSFLAPLRFEEEIEVHLVVDKKSRNSITYEFAILKGDRSMAGHGSMKVACVSIDPETGRMQSTPIPLSIDEVIEIAPAGCLNSSG